MFQKVINHCFQPEIIEKVKQETQKTTFRPPLESLEAADYILKCMKACWHEDPEQRPDIRFVRLRLKEMQVSISEFLVCICLTSNWPLVLGRFKSEHIRQHAGNHGKVCVQFRRISAGEN